MALNMTKIPAGIVTSTKFGQSPKISNEQVFGFFNSDNWMVCYPGYAKRATLGEEARGLFFSSRANAMFGVWDNKFYVISRSLAYVEVGTLFTQSGDVFIDENDAHQVAICDKYTIYIYDYSTNVFTPAVTNLSAPQNGLDFTPGYVNFQNGYFIAPNIGGDNTSGTANPNPEWRLSAINNGLEWPAAPNNIGLLQTKPDQPQACIRFPSRGDLLFVMGKTVTEPWQNSPTSYPFPYVRSSSYNIDYGCLNVATIAESDAFLVWLGSNEKSGPVIMYSSGGDIKQISNDGINYRLAQLNYPSNAYGFLFSEAGHLFYQITFPDPTDNITYVYDFTTQHFFSLMDENRDHHIAKTVVFFNNTYYMISFRDGGLYEMSSNLTSYDYGNGVVHQIPREIYTKTFRREDSLPQIINNYNFPVQMGSPDNTGRIDFYVSRSSGENYTLYGSNDMNATGDFENRVVFRGLGYGNDFSAKIKFNSFGRTVIGEGTIEGY